mmetsp:Transcript_11443/g.13119  ORF Transcript_11443/g.13119 Transcript_11443/m.13119 type:complete len:117 (-) Transcript_11443:370-720(-)
MSASILPHGEIVLVNELVATPEKFHCVRVVGRITSYHPEKNSLVCVDPTATEECVLEVNVAKLGPLAVSPGDLYLFIGEINRDFGKCLLHARVCSNVRGLDMNMYKRALQIRRKSL